MTKELRVDVKYVTVSDATSDVQTSLLHRPITIKVTNNNGKWTQFIECPNSLVMYKCDEVVIDENPDMVIVLVKLAEE